MQFSGAIKLGGGLDDYLTPAQNCVLPLMQTAKSTQPGEKVSMGGMGKDNDPLAGLLSSLPTTSPTTPNKQQMANDITSEVPGSGFTQMKTTDGDKAKITLADCLSCSGCVTTAESILIAQHSSTHLMSVLNAIISAKNAAATITTTAAAAASNDNTVSQTQGLYDSVVVSLSLPSLLSISALFEVTPSIMFGLLSEWFARMGVDQTLYALDAQSQALYTASLEFETRYRNLAQKHNFTLPGVSNPLLTNLITEQQLDPTTRLGESFDLVQTPANAQFTLESVQSTTLPLISSECPGWICVSEKTQGTKMISFMSSTRSPQSVLGVHAKAVAYKNDKSCDNTCGNCECDGNGDDEKTSDFTINPRIFHVSIQPCYDKKLEATREVFELTRSKKNTDNNNNNSTQQSTTTTTTTTTECCQTDKTENCSDDNTTNSSCCQDDLHSAASDNVNVPYVDLVLSTHELVDMLVNNIQIITDDSTTTLPAEDNTTDTDLTTLAEQQHLEEPTLTPKSVSTEWVKLWVNFAQQSASKNTTTITKPIYRVPGYNTSSGGYAESVLTHSLENIFRIQLPRSQNEGDAAAAPPAAADTTSLSSSSSILNTLEWATVANNDIKAVIVDYLGSGHVSEQATNAETVGIYAIRAANATIITHGAILNQTCTATTTLPQTQTSPSPPPTIKSNIGGVDDEFPAIQPKAAKKAVLGGLDDEDDFGFGRKRTANAKPTNQVDLSTSTDPSCNCVSCTPLFKVNSLKYKQIKNKCAAITTSVTDPTLISSSQSLKSLAPIVQTYKLTSPLPSPVCVLSTCTAFGLRNVQAIIQQHTQTTAIRPNMASRTAQTTSNIYHYVEVMSCPSGCINGGAQLTATQAKTTRLLLNEAIAELLTDPSDDHDNNHQLIKDQSQPPLPGQLTIENTKEAQITQQKAILASIQQMYHDLPSIDSPFQNYKTTTTNHQTTHQLNLLTWMNCHALNLLFTKFNPVVVNEQLVAMRW